MRIQMSIKIEIETFSLIPQYGPLVQELYCYSTIP